MPQINESPLVATQEGVGDNFCTVAGDLWACAVWAQRNNHRAEAHRGRDWLWLLGQKSRAQFLPPWGCGLTQPLVVHDAVDPPRQGLHIIRIDQHGGLPYDLR